VTEQQEQELALLRRWYELMSSNGAYDWRLNGFDLAGPFQQALEDAERWRTFIGAHRIRVQGVAGVGDPSGYRHMGIDLWSQYRGCVPEESARARAQITQIIDDMRAFQQQEHCSGHEGGHDRSDDREGAADDQSGIAG
jgi:hypothetical protein